MAKTLKEVIGAIPTFTEWSHADKIRLFAWFIHTHESKEVFTQADIRRTYEQSFLAPPSGFGSFLTGMVDRKEAVKKSGGLVLTRGVRDNLDVKFGNGPTLPMLEPMDRRIIERLAQSCPGAALSYEQGIWDLRAEKRLSWRGPATDLREALRECLDSLAPDNEVTGQPGFKQEQGVSGPTMKQKVRYLLRSRSLSQGSIDAPERAVTAIEETVGSFVRSVYTRSSISTHTPTDKAEVLRVRDYVRAVLCELLSIQ